MRKLLIALIVGVMTIGIMGCKATVKPALAEVNIPDLLTKIPALKQGIAYSLIDSDWNYLTTLELANWKGLTLEAGYSQEDKIIGVISYQLIKLKDYINLPILNLVEFNLGLYGGFGRISIDRDFGEWDAGLSLTLISLKW